MDPRIIDFIQDHHVLTLATSNENQPYCANCFYAYLTEENAFVFTSDFITRHIREASVQNYVAGSVVLETSIIGKIQGIQFNGVLDQLDNSHEFYTKAEKAYLKKFPFALLMKTQLWLLSLTYVKFTDNRLGFGKKIIWEKPVE
jgi:uncharacterized protein